MANEEDEHELPSLRDLHQSLQFLQFDEHLFNERLDLHLERDLLDDDRECNECLLQLDPQVLELLQRFDLDLLQQDLDLDRAQQLDPQRRRQLLQFLPLDRPRLAQHLLNQARHAVVAQHRQQRLREEVAQAADSSYIQTSVIDGLKDEVVAWKEMGISIHVPAGVVSPGDQCKIVIVPVFSGDFIFPEGAALVSGVFAIFTSHQILSPVTIQLEHCVDLSEGDEKMMKFAKVDHLKSRPSPNRFEVCDGGVFMTGSKIGTLKCQTFSHFAQFAFGRIRGRYKAQVFLDSQKQRAYIAVFMDVLYYDEKASDDFRKLGEFEKLGNECFTFAANIVSFETNKESDDHLWKIKPLQQPCKIEKTDVSQYSSPTQYKCFGLIPESGCSKKLHHEVRIQGATMDDLKLSFSCPPPGSATRQSSLQTQAQFQESPSPQPGSITGQSPPITTTQSYNQPATSSAVEPAEDADSSILSSDALIAVSKATVDVPNWSYLVLLIGLSEADYERIKQDEQSATGRQKAIIKKWLDSGRASWAILVSALRDDLVDKASIGNQIAIEHPSKCSVAMSHLPQPLIDPDMDMHDSSHPVSARPTEAELWSERGDLVDWNAPVETTAYRKDSHSTSHTLPPAVVQPPLEDYDPDSTPHTDNESSDEEIVHT